MLKLRESEFFRNTLILFSGSFLSQIIPFLVLPILQKYFYSPADFGLLAVFVSFFELFSQIATLKLEFGIVIQRTLRSAINLVYGAMRVVLGVTIFSFIIVLFFKSQIAEYYGEPKIENYLFLLPLYVLASSMNDIASYWFNRRKRFNTMAVSKVVQTSMAEGVKILLGYLSFSFIGLVIGRMLGFCISACYFFYHFMKQDKRALRLVTTKESNEQIRQNKKFIFFTTPSVFIGTLINLVYLNLFLAYFGKEVVGMIGVSMTYLSAGFGVIAVSFSQVFYSKISETRTKDALLELYTRFSKNLALLALVPILLAYLIPSQLVANILGDEWISLMPIARIMVLWLAVWFVSSSLSFIYMRLGKQGLMLIFDCVHLLMIVAGFFIGYLLNSSLEAALWGFTIAQILYYSFVIYLAFYFIRNADESKL